MTFNQGGFGLIEVLIAMLLLSVGLTGLVRFQVYMEQKADFAEKSTKALYIAENRLAAFRGFTESGGSNTLKFEDIEASEENIEDLFLLSISVDDLLTVPLPVFGGGVYAKRIQINVSWQERSGETKSVTLDTLISRFK